MSVLARYIFGSPIANTPPSLVVAARSTASTQVFHHHWRPIIKPVALNDTPMWTEAKNSACDAFCRVFFSRYTQPLEDYSVAHGVDFNGVLAHIWVGNIGRIHFLGSWSLF